MQGAGTWKGNQAGGADARLWGGVNVLYVGDFFQLPPIKNTPLCTLPQSIVNLAHITNAQLEQGLELFWDGTNAIIELDEQVRCVDSWWTEVLHQCRNGNMSNDTHAFLHGENTCVSGSWLNGRASCGNGCSVQHNECTVCNKERKRRCRVYKGVDNDARMSNKQFRHAISIVANNDLKSEICKRGAAQYARDTGQPILWCQADDRATEKSGLLDDTSLRTRKLAWLSKHAKDTGGLFGMLPLVRGMPVHLTTHIDRSEKALLTGRSGELVGWELDPKEPPVPKDKDHFLTYIPKCLYVRFHDTTTSGKKCTPKWKLGDMEPGVYCIGVKAEYWHADKMVSVVIIFMIHTVI